MHDKENTEYKIKIQLMSLFLFLIFSSCNNGNSNADKKTGDDKTGQSNVGTADLGNQMLYPCHWTFSVEQTVPGEAILVSTAKLDSGWHLYSQHMSDKRIATEFAYDSLSTHKLLGDTE